MLSVGTVVFVLLICSEWIYIGGGTWPKLLRSPERTGQPQKEAEKRDGAHTDVSNHVRVGVYARIANARWKQRWRYQIFEQRMTVANGRPGAGDFWWWQR